KIWDIYKDDKVRIFNAYADFERVQIQTEIQRKRVTTKHVFSSKRRNDIVRNASDIELSLDALETLIKFPEIDCYAITSAHKDMIPLMNRVKYYGKSVHLFFLEAFIAADSSLLDYADEAVSLESLLGLDPIKVGSIDIEPLVLQGVSLVNSFYLRNVGKPRMYLGREFFITEAMTVLRITRQNAIDLLELCLNNGCLTIDLTEDKHEKVILPTAVERVIVEAVSQITLNGKSK
ncbi:MAG TPA: NYN domain-containing protein, partial [Syntrophomonadaceae bacterium]|nr:NYN domain-containing protein [Syntrophomonadaceae bacterium]